MGSISEPAPLPRSYDDSAVLQLEPLCDAFFARKLEQRRFDKAQERTWIASIARDVQSNEHTAAVAKRWLRAISASGKRNFLNFALPLNVDTAQLFVRFFWLIYTEDRSGAKKLLAISRRNWGLEAYLYEYTVSKCLESVDGPMLSSTGVPDWVPSATPYNAFIGATRKRSMLGSTSSTVTSRPKKKRVLSEKIRLTIKIKNPTFNRREGVKSDMKVESPKEASSTRRGITRGNKRKLGQGDSRPPRRRVAMLAPRQRSGTRLTAKMSPQNSETPQLVSEPPVECGGFLDHPKCHRRFNEKPNEHDRVSKDTLLNMPGRKRSRKQMPTPLTGLELNVSPSNVTDAAPASTPETPRAAAVPYTTANGAPGPEPDKISNSSRFPDSATTWPQSESCPVGANKRTSKKAGVTTTRRRKRQSLPDVLPSRQVTKTPPPAEITGAGTIAELDRDMAHIGAMACEYHVGSSAPAFYTFDRVTRECPEDEDDLHDFTPTKHNPSPIELEKAPAVQLPPKPRLPVRPPIWAQSRQEVCESLDAFRSFQGGVYQSNDVVKGYLLGAHSSSRDIFYHNGRLIISHGGGKAEAAHSKHGRLEIQGPEDQLEDDRSVRALLNNYKTGRPLVILADDHYALFPFDLAAGGYTYVVLGLYWIAHAWAELQQVDENRSVVRYKFAFQWCEGQGDPWWAQGTEPTPVVTQARSSLFRDYQPGVTISEEQGNLTSYRQDGSAYCCPCCRSNSPLVYQDVPMCLKPRCPAFWRVGGEDQPLHDTENTAPSQHMLSYSTALLRLRSPSHIPISAESLYPPLPDARNPTPRPFAKGIHCRDCGRLSTRFKWEDFECSHCHRIYRAPPISFSHKDFWLQEQALKFYQHRIAGDSGIVIKGMEFRSRRNGSALPYVQTFNLPYNRGRVHLIPGHPSINGRANDLFREYQRQATTGEIQFRRWPLRAHKCRGQLLSNYFSQNTGAPYQYIGGAERTTPLEDGAAAVLGALDLIRHRIATALDININFNEVLSAAYMEKQKMAFHSDSERGLGPVVASLSLGSVAEMHFRLHTKYADTEGHRRVAMSLVLRHGDVLVMEGAGVQEYYEHAVIPKNFRIVATARCISPENYET